MEDIIQNSLNPQAEPTKEERQKIAKEYSSVHNQLFLLDTILTFMGLVMIIVGGNSGISGRISTALSIHIPNNWLLVAGYVVIINTAYCILFLPFNFYEGYTLEHKFKLSNQTIGAWAKDKLKSFGVSLVLSLIIMEVTYWLLRVSGGSWWIWAGCLWILFSIVLTHLAPILLMPIFFKITPLDNNELSERLKNLAQKTGANILGVFEMDLSKKTKKANAAFTGIGNTKRILLADTLLQKFSHEEIEVILAHELGHYYYSHLWKLLTFGVVSTFAGLALCNVALNHFVSTLGFTSIADIGAFPVFAIVLFFFMLITLPINNTFSRHLEKQADAFALDTTRKPEAFISSMNKLAEQNLADTNPNPIIHFILHSHPSISERIKMAEIFISKRKFL